LPPCGYVLKSFQILGGLGHNANMLFQKTVAFHIDLGLDVIDNIRSDVQTQYSFENLEIANKAL